MVSIYLGITYYSDYKLLDSARNDIAYWLYYQSCKDEYAAFKTSQNDYKNYYKYSPELIKDFKYYYFGKVVFENKTNSKMMTISVNNSKDKESYYGPYKKTKYWRKTFKQDSLLTEKNFNSNQRQSLKKSLDTFYSKIHSFASPKEVDPLENILDSEQSEKCISLKRLADLNNINTPFLNADSTTNVFQAIQKYYYEDSFTVPIIGLKFQPLVACWILTVIILITSVSLNNKFIIIRKFYNEDTSEPWSLFDSFNGISKILVWFELFVIAACPVIAIGNLIFTSSLNDEINGFVNGPAYYIIFSLLILALFIIFLISTLNTFKNIIAIRRLRKKIFS